VGDPHLAVPRAGRGLHHPVQLDADDRNTDVILLTFIGLLVGLIGATVSTIQGIRVWGGRLPGEEPPPDRRQRP